MPRFARKLFSGNNAPGRRLRFRPQIESLERREVLSASSPAPHAVLPNAVGGPSVEQVFFLNKSDGGLYCGDYQGGTFSSVRLNNGQGPQQVQALSAGLAANGSADVFAKGGDGSLWEYTIGTPGWKELLGPGQVQSFAAVNGGRVFAIFSDSTLHLYTNGGGWSAVPTPTTVKALDAVTDKFGHDTVYVLNGDDSFGEVTYLPTLPLPGPMTAKATPAFIIITPPPVSALQPHYTQLAGAGRISWYGGYVWTFSLVDNFSAGTNASGYADVYATWWTGGLYQNLSNTPTGWAEVAAPGTFTAYSAIDQGQVWINGPTRGPSNVGSLPGVTLYGPNGSPVLYSGYVFSNSSEVGMTGQFTTLSGLGAGGNYDYSVLAVAANGDLWGFTYEAGSSFAEVGDLGVQVIA
jgi:hypothetical protein